MSFLVEPVIGQWYQDAEQRRFEVVAQDDDSIEIQYFDGDVAELDAETWNLLGVTPVAAPGDATGPYDELDMGELGFETDTGLDDEDWERLLDE